jgi:arylsulfatase A-like enzyme/Flp pilus assembly protein TadD
MDRTRRHFSIWRRLSWFVFAGLFIATVALIVARRGQRPVVHNTTSAPSATPVLLITVDTLRADHVGAYGARTVQTPAIDSLAAQGVRFDDALVQAPITLPSHTSILSGTYPMWHGARSFSNPGLRPDMGFISEAFERQGYATAAFVSSFALDSSWGLSRGFETYDDRVYPDPDASGHGTKIKRRASDTVDVLLDWLKAHPPGAPEAKPFFVWLHLYDPHSPYQPPEPFLTRYEGHPYDGEIAYADSQLGRLFDYLREIGVYDRALIVLLSDHGESLGEHGELEHGYFAYRSTLRVPLIFKLPRSTTDRAAGQVVQAPVGAVDLAPTLLQLLHLQDPISRQFQGTSFAALVLGKGGTDEGQVYSECYAPYFAFGWSPLRSLSTPRYHYIEAPRPELYDFSQDPSEKHNILGQHAADTATLRDRLLDVERRYTDQRSADASASLSAETVEKLKALGYVAYSAPRPAASDKELPDPKDRLQIYLDYTHAMALAVAHQMDRSDALLASLRVREPGLYIIPCQQGQNATMESRWPDAERYFRECLKLNPSFEPGINGLAAVTAQEGRPYEAEMWLRLYLSRHPQDYLSYYRLGSLALTLSDQAEARRDFEKAVALKPGFDLAQEHLGATLMAMGEYAAAIKPLEAAVSLGMDDPRVLNALGTAYLKAQQPEKAIQAFQKALAKNSDLPLVHLNLALADLKIGDRTNARNEFRTACGGGGPQCQQYEKLFQ